MPRQLRRPGTTRTLAIATIFSKLKIGDKISLVTYSTTDETVLDGYEIRSEQDKETLMGILYGIKINGCTYGSAGIETAYKIGAQNYLKDGNNQVILITDGDLNFGITSKGGLKSLIEEKKKSNLFLSVIGTGLYNYKDDNLEVLAKHGNGTYCVVNDLEDVEESINKRYIALTNIVAKDVKAQVEFNPRFVKNYRLLGYENRELNHEDFTNDAVISEPYGSGSHGVALYELEMAAENSTPASDLKYQTPVLIRSLSPMSAILLRQPSSTRIMPQQMPGWPISSTASPKSSAVPTSWIKQMRHISPRCSPTGNIKRLPAPTWKSLSS